MIVVVNAVAAKMGGAASYARELVRELAQTAEVGRFVFYVPLEQAGEGLALPPNIEWRVLGVGHAEPLRRLWWEQVALRRLLRWERADVLYSTGTFAMFFCPVPQVLLVRNALYFSRPYRSRILPLKSWYFRLLFALRGWLLRLSIRHVTAVMVPSQTLLEEIRASGAVLPVGAEVNHYGTRRDPIEDTAARGVSLIGQPFRLLYPTLYTEHKNLGTVLEALKRLRQQNHLDVQFTTTADPASEPARHTVTARADAAQAQDPAIVACVRFVAPSSPAQAAQLYGECDAVVYPTLVESFGHPLVEAMARGLPIIASDIPINRELAGDVPLYFQPLDPADLADKIVRLACDPELRRRKSVAGIERARAYSWPAHVARLRTLLTEVAARKT